MLTPHPLEEQDRQRRLADPCVMVIFGSTGDLTGRRLLPALYNLGKEGLLSSKFACIGFARREKTNEDFRNDMYKKLKTYSRILPIDDDFWKNFQNQLFYHQSTFTDDQGYQNLYRLLGEIDLSYGTKGNRIYYLATPPKYFPIIIEKLYRHRLLYDKNKIRNKWSRIIIEKPFGHDSFSAKELQKHISTYADESQIFRIDHYLGKETVQNLFVFRFANSIFESIWNAKYIDHVQITVAEDLGIGSRGHFFEEQGMLRDIVQNHMLQLISLVAMEPPVNSSSDAIRDEKVKILQSIRSFEKKECSQSVIRAQYILGYINGIPTKGYLEEQDVSKTSKVETYVALKLFIDNWRWEGVPFYLRTGKRLPKRATEIAIVFKKAPGVIFQNYRKTTSPNILTIRIQPNEGIAIRMNTKVPGQMTSIQPVKMDFCYGSYFGQRSSPEAYERLIYDAIIGDNTLFARQDEVANSWRIVTPILDYWKKHSNCNLFTYEAGTWGPKEADEMMKKDNRSWRLL